MQNLSVLIVDDERQITDLIASVLDDFGYQTACLHDGAAAIELLKTKHYDVLICDLHMPGTNGRDVLEWVHLNRSRIRLLLLSGDVVRKETSEFARICGADFLSKPFSISELVTALQNLSSSEVR